MTWRDAFGFALRSLRRRVGRAVLTVLAVALASALLSSLVISGSVARSRVLDQVSHGGPLAAIKVDAASPRPGALDRDAGAPGAARAIDDATVRRIAKLPHVQSVTAVMVHPVYVLAPDPPYAHGAKVPASVRKAKPAQFFGSVAGVDVAHAARLPVRVLAGRMPAPGARDEVTVTEGYLQRVGLDLKHAKAVVGTELEYGAPRVDLPGTNGRRLVRGLWSRAAIVGVVAQEASSADVELVAPIELVRAARTWSASGAAADWLNIDSEYQALVVVADGLARVGSVRTSINRVGYSTSAPETLIADVGRYVHVVEIVLSGIGSIGLIIAALGIANAMLAAVRERRREIGVLKAIGARDRDVRRVFLLEATVLGAAGGLVGTAAGFAIARVLAAVVNGYLRSQNLGGVQVGLPGIVVVATVGGATLLSLLAGTLPATRAARLPARQAMGER